MELWLKESAMVRWDQNWTVWLYTPSTCLAAKWNSYKVKQLIPTLKNGSGSLMFCRCFAASGLWTPISQLNQQSTWKSWQKMWLPLLGSLVDSPAVQWPQACNKIHTEISWRTCGQSCGVGYPNDINYFQIEYFLHGGRVKNPTKMCSLNVSHIIGNDLWLSYLQGVFAQSIKTGVPITVEPIFGGFFLFKKCKIFFLFCLLHFGEDLSGVPIILVMVSNSSSAEQYTSIVISNVITICYC